MEVRGTISLLMFLDLWWRDMTNVQVVKLFFILRQRGITVTTSLNRSASPSRVMIMKTNESVAWRWNHMRITVPHKYACVCIHSCRKKYTNLLEMIQSEPLLCVCGNGEGDSSEVSVCTLVCVIVCLQTTEISSLVLFKVLCESTWIFCAVYAATMTCHFVSLHPFDACNRATTSDNTFPLQVWPNPWGPFFPLCYHMWKIFKSAQ